MKKYFKKVKTINIIKITALSFGIVMLSANHTYAFENNKKDTYFFSNECLSGIELPMDPFEENYGDVNNDGYINANDALSVLKHAAKVSMLSDWAAELADIDKNGFINAQDALSILKIAAKLI